MHPLSATQPSYHHTSLHIILTPNGVCLSAHKLSHPAALYWTYYDDLMRIPRWILAGHIIQMSWNVKFALLDSQPANAKSVIQGDRMSFSYWLVRRTL